MIKKVFYTLIIAIVALFAIVYITPELEAIDTANITNTFVIMMITLAKWVIPVGAIAGVIIGGIAIYRGRKGGGD